MKKSLSFILAAALFLSVFVSCNKSETTTPNTSAPTLDIVTEPNTDAPNTDAPTEPDSDTDAPSVPDEPVTHKRQLSSISQKISFENMRIAATKNNPVAFKQNVNDILEGKKITRVGVPVIKISDHTKDAKTELHVTTKTLPVKILKTYPLTIPANTYATETVNEWVYFDVDIEIGEDQALAFGMQNETIFWGYANTADTAVANAIQETRGCVTNVNTAAYKNIAHSLLFDIHYEETEGNDNMNSLAGKYISILGASTSTFADFSNSSLYNSTIVNNAQYYPKPEFLSNVNDTWWMRTINALDLKLCVNNSWSGSCITTKVDGHEKAGCMDRATELHNDALGIDPDIIILIIGGNDALRGYDIGEYNGVQDIYNQSTQKYTGNCTLFAQAYATMVHKVKARYPDADIYVCSMLHWQPTKHNKSLVPYNDAIKKIANEFGVTYVDFYNGTSISPETQTKYLHTDGIHPNKAGFAQMSDCIVKLLKERYL